MTPRILMIEDDAALATMVVEYLHGFGFGFEVETAATAQTGMELLTQRAWDALLLDVMLPDRDGFDVCREVRAASSIPVLMLTARGEPADRIVGLELGADDYLPKPFEPRELLARLRAILRRGPTLSTRPREQLRFGRLTIDRGTREVQIDGVPAALTGYQFDLLWLLASNAGRVLSRDVLMERLRGHDAEAFDRSLDVHVSRIRAAIEDDPKTPRRILTVRGAGYLFARVQP